MKVPFVDLQRLHAPIRSELLAAFRDALDASDFIGGRSVEAFEEAFAATVCVPYCVGAANGTAALTLALRALAIGPDDEVVVPAHTFAATAEAPALTGARPVFCDVDPQTLLATPETVLSAVTAATRAVILVHLYGQPVDVPRIRATLPSSVAIIEDCAQAHGARIGGHPVGSLGDIAAWSFYPGKNLGAFGDAGAVTTSRSALADRARMLANHGRRSKYSHEILGDNLRLDALQARLLTIKLGHLSDWNGARIRAATMYEESLPWGDALRRVTSPSSGSVFHLYVVRVRHRDRVRKALGELGVATGVHYPDALPDLPAFSAWARAEGTPAASYAATEVLSLPMFPDITAEEVRYVADSLRAAIDSTAA